MRGFKNFIFGAVLGFSIGSALALLFAPVSGNLLRVRLYDYCTNIRTNVKNAAESRRQELEHELLERQNKL